MYIKKILNNNVVTSVDKDDVEVIVMGRGIAFGKRINDQIDTNHIEKTFIIKNEHSVSNILEVVKDVPIEELECIKRIVDFIQLNYDSTHNETFTIALLDHIHSAILRKKQNIEIKNPLSWDIKRFYNKEYSLGLQVLQIIKEDLGIELIEDDACFIAIHIVNSKFFVENSTTNIINQIMKLMQEITGVIRFHFKQEMDESTLEYHRFISHIKFFSQRVLENKELQDLYDDDLYEMVTSKYHTSYECAAKISAFIQQSYNYQVRKDEEMYLTIHIQKMIYKTAK